MHTFNTALILALAAAFAAAGAAWVTSRVVRSVLVGVTVLLSLSSLISVVRDAADNLMLQSDSGSQRLIEP